MENNFAKEFKQCPVCGSTNRFCEQLTKEAKDKNLVRPNW